MTLLIKKSGRIRSKIDIVVLSKSDFDVKIQIVDNWPSEFGQLGIKIVEDLISDPKPTKLN